MNRSKTRIIRTLFSIIALSLALSACKSSKPKNHWWQFWRPSAPALVPMYPDDEAFPPPPPPIDMGNGGGSNPLGPGFTDGGAITDPGDIPEFRPPDTPPAIGAVPNLPTVYFEFDSDRLTPTERSVLDQSAAWLLQNSGVTVQVEGHCDDRGTPEYNMNLSQRRADSVREYLVSKGVQPQQLITIPYGEERMIDQSGTEQAHALNRRVQFLVY